MEHCHVRLLLSEDTYREMMIVVIDAKHLLPGHPDCAKVAKAYPVVFTDLLRKIKHAAAVMRTYFSCSYACSGPVSLADRAVGRHRIEMRDALIKLFEEPIPESYEADQKVMEAQRLSSDAPSPTSLSCAFLPIRPLLHWSSLARLHACGSQMPGRHWAWKRS
jgi:hypothetical protein